MSKPSPDTDFLSVARLIANGREPPDWLLPGLERFRKFISSERGTLEDDKAFRQRLEQMRDAADCLIEYLPLYLHFPFPMDTGDVEAALEVLPKIKALLAYGMNAPQRQGGPRPLIQRRVCAAVVLEAWKLIHGKAQPRSMVVAEACAALWEACSGEYRIADDWRRDLEDAAATDHAWIRTMFGLPGT